MRLESKRFTLNGLTKKIQGLTDLPRLASLLINVMLVVAIEKEKEWKNQINEVGKKKKMCGSTYSNQVELNDSKLV